MFQESVGEPCTRAMNMRDPKVGLSRYQAAVNYRFHLLPAEGLQHAAGGESRPSAGAPAPPCPHP